MRGKAFASYILLGLTLVPISGDDMMYQQKILPSEIVNDMPRRWIGQRFLAAFSARIGVKLAMAFALVVLFNGMSTLLSLKTVDDLREQTAHVSAEALPGMLTGMNIKADVAQLTRLNAELLMVETDAEFEALRPAMRANIDALEGQLNKLTPLMAEQQSTDLKSLLEEYRASFEKTAAQKRLHLSKSEAYRVLEAELALAYANLSRVVQPININSLFDLQTSLRKITQASNVEQIGRNLADQDVNVISYASTIIASANLVVANVKELAVLDDKGTIFKLRRQNGRELGRLESAARGFVGSEQSEMLRPVVGVFKSYFARNSEKNIFDRKVELAQHALALSEASGISISLLGKISQEIDVLAASLAKATVMGIDTSNQQADKAVDLLLLLAAGIVIVSLLILSSMVRRNIVLRLQTLGASMQKLARGETDFKVSVSGTDEIARMAAQVEVFRQTAVEKETLARDAALQAQIAREKEEEQRQKDRALEEEQRRLLKQQEKKASEERRAALGALAQTLEENTQSMLGDVISSASLMRNTAQIVAASANDTQNQNMELVAAASQSYTNMQTVAAATEELAVSLKHVRDYVKNSHEASQRAQMSAENSHRTVGSLASAVGTVNESVSQIEEIASQTHLLALNAGIEASRAGAAGRGFAVVAEEVKKLATQTATVTAGITDHIKLIRDETGQAQLASREILDIIETMSETVTQIFETIDAQNETVVEIARNVNEAAVEAGHIERGVEAVNQAISGSEGEIKNSRDQSEILMGKAEKLQGQIASFLAEVRAG